MGNYLTDLEKQQTLADILNDKKYELAIKFIKTEYLGEKLRPVEPEVMQKLAGADEKLNGIRETLFQYLIEDVQLIPDIMNGIRELIRDARKEGIQFTLDIMHKHGTAKTFDDRIKKELAK